MVISLGTIITHPANDHMAVNITLKFWALCMGGERGERWPTGNPASIWTVPGGFSLPFQSQSWPFPFSRSALSGQFLASTSCSWCTPILGLWLWPHSVPCHLSQERPRFSALSVTFLEVRRSRLQQPGWPCYGDCTSESCFPLLGVTSLYIKDIISPFILKCLSALLLKGCKSARVAWAGGVFIMKIWR